MRRPILLITLFASASWLVACGGMEIDPRGEGPDQQAGKGDYWFEDGQDGEGCYWNWQCDSTLDLVCRPRYNLNREVLERKCKPRATWGQTCDEDADCADGIHRCVELFISRVCLEVDAGHPECVKDQSWCDGEHFKACSEGHFFDFDCEETGTVCRLVEEIPGVKLASCQKPDPVAP